jgi:mannose-6-phosphate isomerase-like protein (cupin superfamily)
MRALTARNSTRLRLVLSGRFAGLNWHASFRRGGIVLPGARGGRRLAPVTGEKATIVESVDESGGVRIVADFAVEAGGLVPGGEHLHAHCTEHFEVKTGQITFLLDGGERTLGVGEEVIVTPGTWHRW